jgi:hypothetical protein
MRKLKMSWVTEGGQLVCRWVESEEPEKGVAVSAPLNETTSKKDQDLPAEVHRAESRVGRAA